MSPSLPPTLPSLSTLKKIGFIVPSSNTALEPLTSHIFSQLPHLVSAHYTRLRVTTLSLSASSLAQFAPSAFLPAASLLADADLSALLWNGTSGSWSGAGIADEEALVKAIESETGLATSSSTIASVEALRSLGAKKIAIAGPYTDGPTEGLRRFYEAQGFEVVKTSRMDESRNVAFGNTPWPRIDELVREADAPTADAIVVQCTNWPAGARVAALEAALGKPVVDSVCATAWKALRMVGVGFPVFGWGALLRDHPVLARLEGILGRLREDLGVSRTTLRLDAPAWNCHVDTVCAEAVARGEEGVRELKLDDSLNQRALGTVRWLEGEGRSGAKRTLVQEDCEKAEVPPPTALMGVYGVKAQMLAGVWRGEGEAAELVAWVSVHQVGRTRGWSGEEVGRLESAREEVEGVLRGEGWI